MLDLESVLGLTRRRLVTIPKNQSVATALERMVEGNVDAILVTHQDQPWGLLATSDLLDCLHRQRQHAPEDLLIEEVIAQKLITADIDDPIGVTLEKMVNAGIAYLPVLREGVVVGVVSLTDILTNQIKTLMSEIEGLERYIADLQTAEMD